MGGSHVATNLCRIRTDRSRKNAGELRKLEDMGFAIRSVNTASSMSRCPRASVNRHRRDTGALAGSSGQEPCQGCFRLLWAHRFKELPGVRHKCGRAQLGRGAACTTARVDRSAEGSKEGIKAVTELMHSPKFVASAKTAAQKFDGSSGQSPKASLGPLDERHNLFDA